MPSKSNDEESNNETSKIDIKKETINMLRTANSAAVLTGAGISAESGVATFRGPNGIWNKFNPEEVATLEGFLKNPTKVWEWYESRRRMLLKTMPNEGHFTIAKMEKYYKVFTLITQNVDGLHQKAGSKNVIELHGNIWRMKCLKNEHTFEDRKPLEKIPPMCEKCESILRPDVVWFGETLPKIVLEDSIYTAEECDLMLVVGTSATVYPAAALPAIAKKSGAYVLEINLEPTKISHLADETLYGKAGEILPMIWKRYYQE